MWHTADVDQAWDVQVKKPSATKWSEPVHASFTRVAVRGIEPHRVFRAQLSNLKPGKEFDYQVRRPNGETVFQARARAKRLRQLIALFLNRVFKLFLGFDRFRQRKFSRFLQNQ